MAATYFTFKPEPSANKVLAACRTSQNSAATCLSTTEPEAAAKSLTRATTQQEQALIQLPATPRGSHFTI